MRTTAVLIALMLTVVGTQGAEAGRRKIEIENASRKPIFHLEAWASDFFPNGRNLMPFALLPYQHRIIEIDDRYNRCLFTFIAEFTERRQLSGRRNLQKEFAPPKMIKDINICGQKRLVIE